MVKSNMGFINFCDLTKQYLGSVQSMFSDYQKTYFQERPPEFFCLELNGEAGELANAEKKLWKGKKIDFSTFEDEAADVLIALMNYSNARGIDLGLAVKSKLSKIEKIRKELALKGESY